MCGPDVGGFELYTKWSGSSGARCAWPCDGNDLPANVGPAGGAAVLAEADGDAAAADVVFAEWLLVQIHTAAIAAKSPREMPAIAAGRRGPSGTGFAAAPRDAAVLFFLLMIGSFREGRRPRLAERPDLPFMSEQRRFVVVFNPRAGNRKSHEALRRLRTRLDARVATVVETTIDGTFGPSVRAAVRHVLGDTGVRPTVVAVGGDGTLSMTLNALAQPDDATLAVVPAGSGNDFAAALGIPTIDAALHALERHAVRTVDYGTVNGRRFANCVGMGLDAEVGALSARLRKRGYPPAPSYYAAALIGLLMVKPVGVTIEADGLRQRFERGVMVTVGNGHSYGGGFRGAPNALLDDGTLDAYVFSDIEGALARMALMRRIRAGTHEGEHNVTPLRARTLSVEFDRSVTMHVDGEIDALLRADVIVVPRGMRVVAPETSVRASKAATPGESGRDFSETDSYSRRGQTRPTAS